MPKSLIRAYVLDGGAPTRLTDRAGHQPRHHHPTLSTDLTVLTDACDSRVGARLDGRLTALDDPDVDWRSGLHLHAVP
jgi:hypothetical protein